MSKTISNLISIMLSCMIGGLYLLMYTIHITSECIQPVVDPPRKFVIEETETIVECRIMPRIVAEDTYATEEIEELSEYKPLTASKGVCVGPSGKETWYNLPMSRVIKSMRNRGYSEVDYPYFIREDGVKTLGGYVMVAADLGKYDKGDLIETTLGTGIVCDTGDFADTTDVAVDIATNW